MSDGKTNPPEKGQSMTIEDRELILARLRQDLIGFSAEDEVLSDRPSDVFLTGILFPPSTAVGDEQNESLGAEGGGDDSPESGSVEESPLDRSMRPAAMGLSFAVSSSAGNPRISVQISFGVYELQETEEGGEQNAARERPRWKRQGRKVTVPIELTVGESRFDADKHGVRGLRLYLRISRATNDWLVTTALINTNRTERGMSKDEIEKRTFFQVGLKVEVGEGTQLVPRPSRVVAIDDDSRSAELLYRDAVEFATGHTCSATWERKEGTRVATWVSTDWLPEAAVASVSSEGHPLFSKLAQDAEMDPLSAAWIADARTTQLVEGLLRLPGCYLEWIREKEKELGSLDPAQQAQATKHLVECRRAYDRMKAAVDLLGRSEDVAIAFRLANRAMALQRRWSEPDKPLRWRPFQLGFFLLTLCSVAERGHADRKVMDLLWFPTGGGKTEAYLGIVAFLLFHRRLRSREVPDRGAGVAAIMRYTLRLLTTQQFERAAALILACEYLRTAGDIGTALKTRLGQQPFSIGLWVGSDSVPNTFRDAAESLATRDLGRASPAQLKSCPACGEPLEWTASRARSAIHVRCPNTGCVIAGLGNNLPVWTVDSDVYRERPSLVIGTVDKFAQIVRNGDTGVLFGIGTNCDAPDLVLQDELHLISGPLGTMTGLYEIAIDRLCSRGEVQPKIIGSTATIRRAESQIRALFDRDTFQFPPPGLVAGDSCFAVTDTVSPGRLYAGITTAGRSAKFTLQAVCASLLESGVALESDRRRDPYWTLVTYFNSLRELGGALVLMQDDMPRTIEQIAQRRRENPRGVREIKELTSRVTQLEIRDMLAELKLTAGQPGAVDAVLASNMISVGVDVPRLGLMVVNGQPKGISEYIQATSRVGRGVIPGLVVTIYNNNKNRDRSHYETFRTWHATLYREVESSSVTPFASRARDRALHATLVAMVRHLVASMRNDPVVRPELPARMNEFEQQILARVRSIDPSELAGATEDLAERVADWLGRPGLRYYWDNHRIRESLLISAENAAAHEANRMSIGDAWSTPNSMRTVEPGTLFELVERLDAGVDQAQGECNAQ